ncbi:MAG: tetratricopeptide repeat protein [Nitrospira sp.]|nr:tetratricopeptide repeat protein [Nitrospira sp.]
MIRTLVVLVLLGVFVSGCASGEGGRRTLEQALHAPKGSVPAADAANEAGIKLFYNRQWDEARTQFEVAIKAQPMLAQAHYNLGLVFDAQRKDKEARKHFIEAANLAPGDKDIWNSPALRSHGSFYIPEKAGSIFSDPKQHH